MVTLGNPQEATFGEVDEHHPRVLTDEELAMTSAWHARLILRDVIDMKAKTAQTGRLPPHILAHASLPPELLRHHIHINSAGRITST